MAKIPVLEIFGPTIQGEGMVIGQKTMFVRTSGCDYSCAWCDSAFTWDGSQKATLLAPKAIIEELYRLGLSRTGHVTLSGGNPLLHKALGELVTLLKKRDISLAVETQATFWQDWLLEIDDITLSPKPPSSGMTTDFDKLDAFIDKLGSANYSLKIVIFDEADYTFAKQLYVRYPNAPFYIQPGNAETEQSDERAASAYLLERYEWLIERATSCDTMIHARVLPQLHALVWGNRQGV